MSDTTMTEEKPKKKIGMAKPPLPAWMDYGVLPLVNILFALFISGIIIWLIGINPFEALEWLIIGSLGGSYELGYTLYYTTNFIFTGLAVAIAFHANLFNIGGEGQAYVGGLGVGLLILAVDQYLPFWMILPLAIMASAAFGAAWASVPAYLQAYRGSHIVITTIMFNFIASALMTYLLVDVMRGKGQMSPESREFAEAGHLPFMHEFMANFGFDLASTPLNVTFFWALICCVFLWLFIWRTRWGYEIRSVGANEPAAVYAGVNPRRIVMMAMLISGGLAGFVGMNEIMGVHHKILLNFVSGYGFTGIAVSHMGRNHPVGIILASLLFGVLYQGGAELAFEYSEFTREMVVTIQGLIILFCGALAYMTKPFVANIYYAITLPRNGKEA
ncbi:ABC transporter permease [Curvivirga aplysinae]|uniref:ABC transporter permease n=1 Tax=Curvivirga aplysinae TaxID=2529852 RepID=UPI001F355568|nr:ABC transporter permease [Curvivirga aplysinae]